MCNLTKGSCHHLNFFINLSFHPRQSPLRIISQALAPPYTPSAHPPNEEQTLNSMLKQVTLLSMSQAEAQTPPYLDSFVANNSDAGHTRFFTPTWQSKYDYFSHSPASGNDATPSSEKGGSKTVEAPLFWDTPLLMSPE
ncbi:hypothetical protein BDN67DRAFT_1013500 [Paxillus ammoniavirescens]|nr:hypothetical protein BDN67DRAFT_1013500 [Paxillus ammoniavirescens]